MAPHPWIGRATFLFIPLVVEGVAGWDEPPDDYQEFVRRRVYFDPDPQTREDRSLMSYIDAYLATAEQRWMPRFPRRSR